MASEIKAIIFDIGGVLFLGKRSFFYKGESRTKGVHEYISRNLNISVDQWMDSIDSVYALGMEGKISKNQFLEQISKKNGVSKEKLYSLFIKAYKKNFKLNKKLFKKAISLKERGYLICILSDQNPISQEILVPKTFNSIFSPIILSTDTKNKLRKPNPKIYKLILKKLKISPRKCLFIDNQDWNILPAKKLGFRTILFKDNKQLFKHPVWTALFKQ